MSLRVAPGQHDLTRDELKKQIATAAIAFRGYDASNLGRGAEFLAHPVYGPIVRPILDRASVVCGDVLKKKVDLASRMQGARALHARDVRGGHGDHRGDGAGADPVARGGLRDLGARGGLELRPQHRRAVGAGVGGVYEMEQLLPIPLALAHDCAGSDRRYDHGDPFEPSGVLDAEHVQRLCSSISSLGHGLVGPSTYLSPYQVLLLGQGDTLDLLEAEMRQYLPSAVTLRRRPNHWPPLHTPLVWERSVPNRAAVALYHTDGGHRKPKPTVVSCTTGRANYDEWNSREILTEWTDHPQRLWEVMEHTLASGADLVIHVGPEPKLIPMAFERLSGKIMKQLKSRHLDRLGRRVLPSISRNHWLARKLPLNAVLFRAPFVNHLILEDWLLAQEVA